MGYVDVGCLLGGYCRRSPTLECHAMNMFVVGIGWESACHRQDTPIYSIRLFGLVPAQSEVPSRLHGSWECVLVVRCQGGGYHRVQVKERQKTMISHVVDPSVIL